MEETNQIETYDTYISADGYFHISSSNKKYLIDPVESNLPIMPEASESAVRIAGRDGDLVLNTSYEPIPFEIVCYTEENLTPQEKIEEEEEINALLNKAKNEFISLAFEERESFYNVKYNGALTTTRYPKHLKFSIPLKSSSPYGKYFIQREERGNSTFESDTIKDCGNVITIYGPATNPKISLNDYEIYYDYSLLDGDKLEIDSSKSTITHINSLGVKTNAMRYYNHQFPKIKNGTNQLTIIDGIEDENQVSISWYDLKI